MNYLTRIIGLSILVITEILIIVDVVFSIHKDISPAIGFQIAVFTTVWGSVTAKNFFDMMDKKALTKINNVNNVSSDSNIGGSVNGTN